MESLLTNLANELLVQDITEPSAVLAVLSDHDLQTDYDRILEHFAPELLIGGCQELGLVERQASHRRQRRPDSFARSRHLRCAARSAATGGAAIAR